MREKARPSIPSDLEIVRIVPEIQPRESGKFWREFARLITLFDLCSLWIFRSLEIGEFFRKWRARLDSNQRPPA
jgi:hypothetical protein